MRVVVAWRSDLRVTPPRDISTGVRSSETEKTCHAIAASLPTPLRPTQLLILTDRQEDYPPGIVTVGIDDPRLDR